MKVSTVNFPCNILWAASQEMDDIQSLTTWKCFICTAFVALTLRALMGHYYSTHSNSPNFFVKCGVNCCPATYRRYHSFYKHVVRNHSQEYDNRKEITVCESIDDSQSVNGNQGQSDSRTEPEQSNYSSDTESADSLSDDNGNSENEEENENLQVEVCRCITYPLITAFDFCLAVIAYNKPEASCSKDG